MPIPSRAHRNFLMPPVPRMRSVEPPNAETASRRFRALQRSHRGGMSQVWGRPIALSRPLIRKSGIQEFRKDPCICRPVTICWPNATARRSIMARSLERKNMTTLAGRPPACWLRCSPSIPARSGGSTFLRFLPCGSATAYRVDDSDRLSCGGVAGKQPGQKSIACPCELSRLRHKQRRVLLPRICQTWPHCAVIPGSRDPWRPTSLQNSVLDWLRHESS